MIKKVLSALLISIVLSLLVLKVAMAVDPLLEYDKYLKTLPKNTASSALKARDQFVKDCGNNQSVNKEKCYLKFQAFYFSLIDNINQKEIQVPQKKENEVAQTYKNQGLKLTTSEGMYYLSPSYEFINSSFSKYLPSSWKEYFQYRIKETDEGYLEDAGLLIDWEKMRERITFLDNFIKKYPNFPLISVVNNTLADYINSYVLGTNNSPVTGSYDTKKLSNDAKQSFEKFLTQNKTSKYYTLISDYYSLLKKQNFMVTDPIIDAMNKKLPKVNYDPHYETIGAEVK